MNATVTISVNIAPANMYEGNAERKINLSFEALQKIQECDDDTMPALFEEVLQEAIIDFLNQ